ncbi:rubrerythrin [Alkalibacillus flavidus]|uniref:Rubrerythrin n=1 Tax=Alkalibacillus flavidus TaxID=546021 RepID=A0ABV2KTM2_9BACI
MLKNSIATQIPELLKDWDYDKTKYKPEDVTTGSDKIIYWTCHVCGHQWSTQAKNRAIHNTGCQQCHRRWNTSFNELTLAYYLKEIIPSTQQSIQLNFGNFKDADIYIPDFNMVIEYDSFYRHEGRESNDGLKTEQLKNQGYEVVRLREKGLSEIVGAKNIVLELGPNSKFQKQTIRDLFKEILQDLTLHKAIQDLSIDVDRDQLEILRQVPSVTMPGNLLDVNPKVSETWDVTRNYPFNPEHFKPSSNYKVWWRCAENHSWPTQINVRHKGHGCPYCAGIRATSDKTLTVVNPNLASEWDYDKNELSPNNVAAHSNQRFWWICPDCQSSYDKASNERMAGENCPYCAGKRTNKTNSLTTLFPDIVKEWNPSKNGDLTPDDVTKGSKKYVWWICQKGHEWKAPVYSRTTGNKGCKVCYELYGRSKPRTLRDPTESLASKAPDIASQWHPTKNDISALEVGRSARYKFWWLCHQCGYEWQKALDSRSSSQCPNCKQKT